MVKKNEWNKLAIGTKNYPQAYAYYLGNNFMINLFGGDNKHEWIIELRDNGKLKLKTNAAASMSDEEVKAVSLNAVCDALQKHVNADLELLSLLNNVSMKNVIALSDEEIKVMTVALRQHYIKMVDDNGEPKNSNHKEFVHTLFLLMEKFKDDVS